MIQNEVNVLQSQSSASAKAPESDKPGSAKEVPRVCSQKESYLDFIIKYNRTRGAHMKVVLENEWGGAKAQKL